MPEIRSFRVAELTAMGVLLIEDGNHGEYRPRPDEFIPNGVAYIRAADMTSGVIDFSGAGKISIRARARIRKGIGRSGDVILSHKGTVGRIAVAPANSPDFVCSPQTTFWRSLDRNTLDQGYLRYVMASSRFVAQLDYLKGQTDMAPYVSLTDQRNLTLELPPIKVQKAIAEVLGALDDKIAANAQLCKTALGLAETIFSQSIADVPFSDLTFADVAAIGGGGTPSTSILEYWDGEIPWLTPTDVTALPGPYLERTSRTISQSGLASCASPLYPAGSVMMTSRATIGAFAIAQQPTAVNQGFIVVNPTDDDLKWWIFHEMRDRVDEFLTHANGATFMELSRGNFKRLRVRLADRDVMVNFGTRVGAVHAVARQALLETQVLAATRDTLLPALMSGKLRVKDAEKQLEQVL